MLNRAYTCAHPLSLNNKNMEMETIETSTPQIQYLLKLNTTKESFNTRQTKN